MTEALLVAAAVALAALPLLTALRRAGSRALPAAAGLGVVATAALAWAAAGLRPAVHDELSVTARPRALAAEGYATSDSCRACHPHEHATWHASYHRTMTQVATVEGVLGDFSLAPEASTLVSPTEREVWSGERRGDELWAAVRAPDGTVEEHRIVLTTGSHHMQVYWVERGDRALQMAPFVWLVAEDRWITRDSSFLQSPYHSQRLSVGKWNQSCIHCHTTGGQPRYAGRPAGTVDTRVTEFGISCEACHGPAQEHAEANRDPLHRYSRHFAGEDPSVVRPDRLAQVDPARASETCGQCHGVWLPQPGVDLDAGRPYRPGDALADTQHLVEGVTDEHPAVAAAVAARSDWHERHFWSDGMVRVSGREYSGLVRSPCFTHGDAEAGVLSCFSCHRMHPDSDDPRPLAEWADDQLAPGMRTNAACTQCHAGFGTEVELEAHTRHAPGSSGSECANCHTPHTAYGLLKAIRSHEIDSPDVSVTLATGRPNACNLCHLDRPLAWTAEHLETWYGIPAPALEGDAAELSAVLVDLMSGDAGQRALVAWSLGWEPAQEASGVRGSEWPAPFLAMLLNDNYQAVRYIAYRSLRTLPSFADLELDWLGPREERDAAMESVMLEWMQAPARGAAPAGVLIDSEGRLRIDDLRRLAEAQDETPMDLAE